MVRSSSARVVANSSGLSPKRARSSPFEKNLPDPGEHHRQRSVGRLELVEHRVERGEGVER